MPPSGGLLGVPGTMAGYLAQAMSSRTELGMAPLSTSPLAALYTYGQLTMNPPELAWNAERASSSVAVDMAGGAAGERARPPTTRAAASPAGESMAGVA